MGKKILVGDDEVSVREIISLFLSAEGFQVIPAENADRVIFLATEHFPDLIILDALMPKMSGYVISNLLKRNPDTARIPIIMMVSSRPLSVGITYQSPTPYQIVKPIKPEQLVSLVGSILKSK